MNDFQRMNAIPQQEYVGLSSLQQVKEPVAQQLYKAEKQHNKDETIRDPYRRLVMQLPSLEDMKKLKEQIRNSLSAATPKPYRNRAQALLQNVEYFLRFNHKGEIYTKEQELIPGSRIEDLINYAVRDRRRNIVPTGWSSFLSTLREHNIPKSILNRNTLDELEEKTSPLSLKPKQTKRMRHKARQYLKRSSSSSPLKERGAKRAALEFLKNYHNG